MNINAVKTVQTFLDGQYSDIKTKYLLRNWGKRNLLDYINQDRDMNDDDQWQKALLNTENRKKPQPKVEPVEVVPEKKVKPKRKNKGD